MCREMGGEILFFLSSLLEEAGGLFDLDFFVLLLVFSTTIVTMMMGEMRCFCSSRREGEG